mgnify:CR=1 FL=1|tara:strand:+ start:16718 stop:17434 length:717 start_codon:yes stop_codon:yes gene_type:complete
MSDRPSDNRTDFIDQQRELSSAGGSKAPRFFDNDGHPRSRQEKERKLRASAREFTRLMDLINSDLAYAAARQEFGTFLSDVEQATETALAKARKANDQAQDGLQSILDSANRLPDGRAVFRDANGNVYTEDGEQVSAEDAASIVWKDAAPSYEDYQAARTKAEEARQQLEDVERYQRDVLGPARDRFDDEDNPMTLDEFEQHKKRIEEEMPDIVAQEMPSHSASVKPETIGAITKPSL